MGAEQDLEVVLEWRKGEKDVNLFINLLILKFERIQALLL